MAWLKPRALIFNALATGYDFFTCYFTLVLTHSDGILGGADLDAQALQGLNRLQAARTTLRLEVASKMRVLPFLGRQ